MKDNFPLGLAGGNAFCNREKERRHLLSNIHKGKPTLIVSPRRYGKTSLVLQTIRESKLPYAHMDFFAEITQEEIIKNILKGIGMAIGKIASTPQKAMNAVKEFFAGAQVKFSIDIPTISIEFDTEPQNSKDHLKMILDRFEVLASKKKKRIVLFLDEFQRVGQVVKDQSVEAILRHAAQQSKYIVFIFSGSNRHLLSQMFDDRRRPFYKLCDRIYLNRISSEHYHEYIYKSFREKWRLSLTKPMIDAVLEITERHPYYVNLLCSRLLLMSKTPKEQEVQRCWDQLAMEEKSQIASEMDLLSDNQRSLLITIAKVGKIKSPQSKEFLTRSGLSASSTAQSLAVLEERDYISQDIEGYYELIDPLLRRVITL